MARRHRLTPGMDATKDHMEFLFGRSTRRALHALAASMRVDVSKCKNTLDIWKALTERIESGVQNPRDPILGDPFAVFVTGICADGHPLHRQTAVHKTGHMLDEFECKKVIEYLKHQDPVRHCDAQVESGGGCQCPSPEDATGFCRRCDRTIDPGECGKPITTWQTDHTRISTFEASARTARGVIMEARGGRL